MEENSDEKLTADDELCILKLNYANNTSEELKEMTIAAFIVASLKYDNLDEKEGDELCRLKSKFLGSSFEANQVRESIEYSSCTEFSLAGVLPQENIDSGNSHIGLSSATVGGELVLPLTSQPVQEFSIVNGDSFSELGQLGKIIFSWSPPALPPVERLNGFIGRCSRPFEKQLTVSDVSEVQSRLTLTKKCVIHLIMPLLYPTEDIAYGINVTIYDFEGKEYPMVLRKWPSKTYVLNCGWKSFFHEHSLKAYQDFVTIWMFRHNQTGKLCVVIISRRFPELLHQPVRKRREKQQRAMMKRRQS